MDILDIPEQDLEYSFFKSSGPGGQKKNVTESSVRLRHLPTGITVVSTASRSQHRNKRLALEELKRRLEIRNRKKKPRRPTRPGAAVKAKRLGDKKIRSAVKRLRKPPEPED